MKTDRITDRRLPAGLTIENDAYPDDNFPDLLRCDGGFGAPLSRAASDAIFAAFAGSWS